MRDPYTRPSPSTPRAATAPAQAAQELAAELPRLRLRGCRRRVRRGVGRGRLHAVEDLAGSAGLRESGQVRAARDDAHPRAQRLADRRVRARAAHLRADQHDPEARHRRLPVGRGQALLRARRRRLPGHRPRRLKVVEGKIQRQRPARRGRLDHHPAGRQELPADAASARWSASSRRRSSPSASSAPTPRTRSSSSISTRSIFGIGAYGVAAASLNYFNKELQDLTIEEVAYLAALPKAPNNYHPFRRDEAGD